MTTLTKIASSLALSLSLVLGAGSAFAGQKGEKVAFPVEGATFKQRVEARLQKQQTKLEERIANKQVPADKAEQIRARFAERRAKINAAVEKAVADGTVTKEEAKEVRQAAGGGRHHKGQKQGKPALGKEWYFTKDGDRIHSVAVSLLSRRRRQTFQPEPAAPRRSAASRTPPAPSVSGRPIAQPPSQ